jgi:hypothetical protein
MFTALVLGPLGSAQERLPDIFESEPSHFHGIAVRTDSDSRELEFGHVTFQLLASGAT